MTSGPGWPRLAQHVWMLSRSGTLYSVAVNIKPDMLCVLVTSGERETGVVSPVSRLTEWWWWRVEARRRSVQQTAHHTAVLRVITVILCGQNWETGGWRDTAQ